MATHQLSPFEIGWVDPRKSARGDSDSHMVTGSQQGTNAHPFIATGSGSTTTIVGAAANLSTSLNCLRLGEKFMLFASTGVAKEDTVFTVTAHNGTTTVTFSPAAKVATASGDTARITASDALSSMNSMDTFLMSASGGSYSQAAVDKMNANDKQYAFRVAVDPNGTRGF
jgi:hypothetical protein